LIAVCAQAQTFFVKLCFLIEAGQQWMFGQKDKIATGT